MVEKVAHSDFLSVLEVARWLGLSRPMIYKLIKTGELPAVKIGARLLLQREEVQNFIERNKIFLDV